MRFGSEHIVINTDIDEYKLFDPRIKKPIFFTGTKKNNNTAVMQEVDEIIFKHKKKENTLSYFSPNNVGILLSIATKSLNQARFIFYEYLNPKKINHSLKDRDGERVKIIQNDSKLIYDFIEHIQISIVFGYTALETFTNLSIPTKYEYSKKNHKGILEIYDKKSIERWLSLKDKISYILTDIYSTKEIPQKIFTKFTNFENLRHEIIHQKSINETQFYKNYFKENIFKICSTPEEIITFFFENRKDKTTTNPLWPWIINAKNDFPALPNSEYVNLELLGNINGDKFNT